MISVFFSNDLNVRLSLVQKIVNPFYANYQYYMKHTGNDVYWSDKLLSKCGRAFPRGKARRKYMAQQKKLRNWQLKIGAVKLSNR